MRKVEETPNIRIIFVGYPSVGKTQLFNRWSKNQFLNFIMPSQTYDFSNVNIQNATLKLWDSPGSDPYVKTVGAYITGSQIVCIVVSATDTKKDKLAQIDSWIKTINQSTFEKPAIVILENKMDLDNKFPLTSNDFEKLEGEYIAYKAVSAKHEINLTNILQDILQPVIEAERFKKHNDVKICRISQEALLLKPNNRSDYAQTKQKINSLTDSQANIILHSLLNALTYGPLNTKDKGYDIAISGGKSLILDDNTLITVPEHVFRWISKIKGTPLFSNKSKTILAELYDEIDQASITKPLSRSKSTHDYYNHCLIKFIAHAVERNLLEQHLDYISTYNTIDALPEDKINIILNEIMTTLENGIPSNNNDKPYNVGFWGGREHISSLSHQKIKVPEHIGALLQYLSTTTNQPKEKLHRVLDSVLIASYSTSANRDISTQNLYQQMPRDLMSRIHQMHIQTEPEISKPRRDG